MSFESIKMLLKYCEGEIFTNKTPKQKTGIFYKINKIFHLILNLALCIND